MAREGLAAYSQHPLLRCVSLDRSFYHPLSASEYAAYAAQVPAGFRFLVKAPSLICDAVVRGKDGRGLHDNAAFLDSVLARTQFVEPATEGLGRKIGALVFQLSPLPPNWLARVDELLARLATILQALPELRAVAADALWRWKCETRNS